MKRTREKCRSTQKEPGDIDSCPTTANVDRVFLFIIIVRTCVLVFLSRHNFPKKKSFTFEQKKVVDVNPAINNSVLKWLFILFGWSTHSKVTRGKFKRLLLKLLLGQDTTYMWRVNLQWWTDHLPLMPKMKATHRLRTTTSSECVPLCVRICFFFHLLYPQSSHLKKGLLNKIKSFEMWREEKILPL